MSEIVKDFNEGLKLIQEKKYSEANDFYVNLAVRREKLYNLMASRLIQQKGSPIKRHREYAEHELNIYSKIKDEIDFMIAKLQFQLQPYEEAIDGLKTMILSHPNCFQSLQLLTEYKLQRSQNSDLESFILECIQHNFGSLAYRQAIVEFYLKTNNLSNARKEVEKIMKINKFLAPVWNYLGLIEAQEQNMDAAIAAFRQVTIIQPMLANGWDNLGNLYFQTKKYEDAEKCLRKALDLDENHVKSHFNLALILKIQKNYQEAVKHLQKAKDITPKVPQIMLELGQALELGQNKNQAKLVYESLLKLDIDIQLKEKISQHLKILN